MYGSEAEQAGAYSNATDLYSEGVQFKAHMGYWMLGPRLCWVQFCPDLQGKCQNNTTNQDLTASFYGPSNSLFTPSDTTWCQVLTASFKLDKNKRLTRNFYGDDDNSEVKMHSDMHELQVFFKACSNYVLRHLQLAAVIVTAMYSVTVSPTICKCIKLFHVF